MEIKADISQELEDSQLPGLSSPPSCYQDSQLELETRSKIPRGGRDDEGEGESEGITGEKDEEGGGCRVAVASRRPAVTSAVSSRARVMETGSQQ